MKKYLLLGGLSLIIIALLAVNLGLSLNIVKPQGGIVTFTIGPKAAEASVAPDYIVDGVDDHIQAQAALSALPSGGGKLIFEVFNYDFGATVTRAINNVIIEGMGLGTYFANNGADNLFSAGAQSGWVFRDLSTDAGGINVYSATRYSIENVMVGSDYFPVAARTSSYVVAAYNASMRAKSQADYVCDGTSDQTEIQAAIDALESASGGVVTLSEGTFNISAPLVMQGGAYGAKQITLQGMGESATTIYLGNGANCNMLQSDGSTVYVYFNLRGLTLNGNRTNQSSGNGIDITKIHLTIDSVTVMNVHDKAIYANGASGQGGLDASNLNIGDTPYGIYLSSYYAVHLDNVFIAGYSPSPADFYLLGYYQSGGELWAHQLIVDGAFDSNIYLVSMTQAMLTDLWVAQGRTNGLNIDGSTFIQVKGGIYYSGTDSAITISSSTNCLVEGTEIHADATEYGIRLRDAGAQYNRVLGNDVSQAVAGTEVVDAGSNNIIKNNVGFADP